jgi:glutamate-1-semialdehyde 2,1-aminomutase
MTDDTLARTRNADPAIRGSYVIPLDRAATPAHHRRRLQYNGWGGHIRAGGAMIDGFDWEQSSALLQRYARLVPGAAHTYAKGDDQYPEGLAPFIVRGNGARVWDADGHEYLEYGSGLRSVSLGHGHPRVVSAAARAMSDGTNFVRPTVLEVEVAEEFLACFDGLDMVKFAKNGSDATTAATRLARAATGRDLIAICGDQPFFSVDDWFIGTTAMPAGVPSTTRHSTVTFRFNDVESLRQLFAEHQGRIACVVLEAATAIEPEHQFLQDVRRLCDQTGTVLVFDEMITGFRWHLRGAQHVYGVRPDLATFGKAMGNGFAIAALAGRRELMELGGLDHDRERVFLLSTTHGAESHALAAAREVIRVYQTHDVTAVLRERGQRLADGVRAAASARGLQNHFFVLGHPANLVYATTDERGQRSQAFRTLFLQETIRRGLLAPSFVVSAALTEQDIDQTVDIVGDALDVYAKALESGTAHLLEGRSVKPVFRPFC